MTPTLLWQEFCDIMHEACQQKGAIYRVHDSRGHRQILISCLIGFWEVGPGHAERFSASLSLVSLHLLQIPHPRRLYPLQGFSPPGGAVPAASCIYNELQPNHTYRCLSLINPL